MRVISFDALRLCALVTAGVTSGYLWRAAFESSSPEERLAATPRIIEQAPAPPVVRIPPSRVTSPHRPAVVHHVVVRRPAARPLGRVPGTLISRPVSTPKPEPVATPPKPAPTPPQPAPAPTTTTAPSQPTTAPATPTQAAAAPPPPAPTPPTTPSTSGDDSRPGWGKGDKNHDHTGPGKP